MATSKGKLDPAKKKAIDAVLERLSRGELFEPFYLTKHVWWDTKGIHDAGWILEGADPYTLRELAGGMVLADKTQVWQGGKVVPGADGETFRTYGGVDGVYASDANHVYYDRAPGGYHPISGADPKTFKLLGFAYARDRERFYCRESVLEGIGNSFTLDACGFLKGEQSVYHYQTKLPVDAASFRVVNLDEKLKDTNPFIGEFQLADSNGRYRFRSWGHEREFSKIED